MLWPGSIQSLVECGDVIARRDREHLWSTEGVGAPIGRRFCETRRIAAPASARIFVGSKAPWFEITDDLPQHQGYVVRA
jgi:hypothetical protein